MQVQFMTIPGWLLCGGQADEWGLGDSAESTGAFQMARATRRGTALGAAPEDSLKALAGTSDSRAGALGSHCTAWAPTGAMSAARSLTAFALSSSPL